MVHFAPPFLMKTTNRKFYALVDRKFASTGCLQGCRSELLRRLGCCAGHSATNKTQKIKLSHMQML